MLYSAATQPGLAAFASDWAAGLIGHHNAAFDAEEAGHYAGFDADEAEASFAAFVADKAGTFDEASVCDQRLDNGYADPAFDADEAADQNQTFDHAVFQMAKATCRNRAMTTFLQVNDSLDPHG